MPVQEVIMLVKLTPAINLDKGVNPKYNPRINDAFDANIDTIMKFLFKNKILSIDSKP